MLTGHFKRTHILGYTTALLLSASLAGCGGGGGTDSTPNSGDTPITPDPSPNPVINSSADIIVPESLGFSESREITLSVHSSEDIHISICKPSTDAGLIGQAIDYEDCLLKSWVRTDSYEASVNAPDHIDLLLAAVLIPGDPATLTIYEWRKEQGNNWDIQI